MQQISDQAASRVSTLDQQLDQVVSFKNIIQYALLSELSGIFQIIFSFFLFFFLEISKPGRRQIDRWFGV